MTGSPRIRLGASGSGPHRGPTGTRLPRVVDGFRIPRKGTVEDRGLLSRGLPPGLEGRATSQERNQMLRLAIEQVDVITMARIKQLEERLVSTLPLLGAVALGQ